MEYLFTGVYQPDVGSPKFVGQIYRTQELETVHLHYLLPPEGESSKGIVPLLEGLIQQAGHWGAKQVTADLAVNSEFFGCFRETGFSVLAKQRVFQCDTSWQTQPKLENRWRYWTKEDIRYIRNLHTTLVPPVIQSVEPLTRGKNVGMVYCDQKGELKGYADLVYGPAGVWVLPFLYPQNEEHPRDLLGCLLHDLRDLNGRPVYLVARSYQPWLENALLDSPAKPGPEQALLVRNLALREYVKAEISFTKIENGKPEPTMPLAPIKNDAHLGGVYFKEDVNNNRIQLLPAKRE
jgi:hypothetical protein